MFGIESLLAQTQPSQTMAFVDRLARTPMSTVLVAAVVATVIRLAVYPYLTKTPIHLRQEGYRVVKFVNDAADAFVYAALIVFLLIRPFVLQTFQIPSGSMIDTLLINDFIVANKWVYRVSEPQRKDIIVFKPPRRALYPGQSDSDFIKRLIGLPGETIEWKGRKLYIDGKLTEEPYVDFTDPASQFTTPLSKERESEADVGDFKLIEVDGQVMPLMYDADAGLANAGGYLTVAKEYMATSVDQMKEWIATPAAKIPQGYYLFMGDNRNGSFDGRGWGLVPREDIIGKSEFIWMPVRRWGATR
ncbi:MAG: signal peptidase I [Fimbriimonadaceae bacterium]|nr:signal peptidase I [Fimbriimonadaceae bacterium]QYK55476.1 MAG: signal peptidase I [Fimbriimonadaceae bacterium]